MIVAGELGWRAHAALGRTGGVARVVARMTQSTWLDADGEILWLGPRGMHPRAVVANKSTLDGDADAARLETRGARVWRPAPLVITANTAPALTGGARALRGALREIGAVDGLAHLLASSDSHAVAATPGVLAEVLTRAASQVTGLARACATDRAADAVAPAIALLGLGPGLTPSGDDFVGGVFFGRRCLAAAGRANHAPWREAADVVRIHARARTHAISQALLGDLLDGESHASLHEVIDALARSDDPRPAARALTRIGHSSGWDILAGVLVALDPR